MRTAWLVTFGLTLGACATTSGGGWQGQDAREASACPLPGSPETAADCPWAAIARDLSAASAAGRAALLSQEAPTIAAAVATDRTRPELLALWGQCLNFDERARGIIVDPALVDLLNAEMRVAPRVGLVTHAGVQHTYGYLFSNLLTPYGYKRARWVNADVAAGFGLAAGTLGPEPKQGTFLANVTYLAGRLAFAGEPAAARLSVDGVAAPLRALKVASWPRQRLSEKVVLPGGRTVELRTDFVPFPVSSASASTHWLIYSVRDSAVSGARLITAFPISAASYAQYTSPQATADIKPVTTRFNAYVEGLTGSAVPGTRRLSRMAPAE